VFDLPQGTTYPLAFSRYGKGAVQLNLAYLKSKPAFAEEPARRALYDRVATLAGPLSTRTLNGFPAFPAEKLRDAAVRSGLVGMLRSLVLEIEASEPRASV
jgi:hypothetical protein